MHGPYTSIPDAILSTGYFIVLLLIGLLINTNWMISAFFISLNMSVIISVQWIYLDIKSTGLAVNNIGCVLVSIYACYFFEKKCKL